MRVGRGALFSDRDERARRGAIHGSSRQRWQILEFDAFNMD
jgi:hypothetical protein